MIFCNHVFPFSVISKVSDNGQYLIGGRDCLKQATKILGLLAQQNEVSYHGNLAIVYNLWAYYHDCKDFNIAWI